MKNRHKIICTVTNDLNYDQRMKKICSSLASFGHEVMLVGRLKKGSKPLTKASYKQHRITCWFEKGKFFYIEYNLRLFFFLLRKKATIYNAIDTDTLLANWLASKLKNRALYFDAHEYFTEMEEVVARPFTKWVWKKVEDWCVPGVDKAYTISNGYATLFEKRFQKKFEIIRNIAVYKQRTLDLPRKFILYQGSVNHGRGLEELLEAMPKVDYPLVICGEGDVYEQLKTQSNRLGIDHKVTFTGYLPPSELEKYTIQAKIGITLFSNDGLSNHHSLCNRFFDYLHNGAPQIAMNYPEYITFNERFEVAILLSSLSPESIAKAINTLLENDQVYLHLKQNAINASKVYQWGEEEAKLKKIYE